MWGEEGSHGFSQPNANDVYEAVSAEVLERNQIFHDISWGQTRGQNEKKVKINASQWILKTIIIVVKSP